MKYRNISAH